MNKLMLYMQLQQFCQVLKAEEGQDLIEYALVVGLIAFGAVSGMSALAGGINTAFANIVLTLAANT